MTEQNDYLLLSSDIFGKDQLLSNFLQDNGETTFPSPASSTDTLDSPIMMTNNLSIDPTVLQNLPMSVLQSLAAMYQQNDLSTENNSFEQFVKFEEDNSISPSHNEVSVAPPTTTKPKTYRPPRQLECHNCHVTKTPLWRRTPDRAHSLCNACGLYYKQYGTHRPLHVRQKQQTSKPSSPAPVSPMASPQQSSDLTEMRAQCNSCQQTNTQLWKNSENGESLCNSCGIYQQSSPSKRRRESENDLAMNKRQSIDMPALFPATPVMPPSPPSVAAQSKEWAEIDDTRFKTLLARMNAQQMHGFLGMLERRCSILRSILVPQQE